MKAILCAVFAGAVLFAPPAAFAGDFADRELLGFSRDGAYFAFEEFGVLDGSAIPYSNVYVLAVDKDAWIDGTPIRLKGAEEGADLDDLRVEAHSRVAPILKKYGIAVAGRVAASNPFTEVTADPHKVRFFLDYGYLPAPAWDVTVTLTTTSEPVPCGNLGPVKGFRLVLTDSDGVAHVLHDDANALPSSRGCPRDYSIADVITYFPKDGDATMIVLLGVESQGFEGPDRRYLAVASRFATR